MTDVRILLFWGHKSRTLAITSPGWLVGWLYVSYCWVILFIFTSSVTCFSRGNDTRVDCLRQEQPDRYLPTLVNIYICNFNRFIVSATKITLRQSS